MTRPFHLTLAVVASLALVGMLPASAQTPPDLTDLVGARGAGGETQMQARGYRFLRVTTVGDAKWSMWWNDRTRRCVQIATSDGRYSTINGVPAANCGQRDNDRAAGYGEDRNAGYGQRDRDNRDYGRRDDDRGTPDHGGYGDRSGLAGSLTLICYGEGHKPGLEYRSGYEWNPDRHRYEYRGGYRSGTQGFDSQVQVEVFGDHGRIHLTGKLIAPIHSGGRDDWWELQDLRVDPYRITGKYRLNGLNAPRVDIDRRSGRIAIDGIEHFRGDCDVGDWGDNATRF